MSDPWTPGPWTYVEDEGGQSCHVYAPREEVAYFVFTGNPHTLPNARLIAAAPEMAEFIERYAMAFDSPVADALLSRIRGEA